MSSCSRDSKILIHVRWADLNLRLAHMSKDTFSHVWAQFITGVWFWMQSQDGVHLDFHWMVTKFSRVIIRLLVILITSVVGTHVKNVEKCTYKWIPPGYSRSSYRTYLLTYAYSTCENCTNMHVINSVRTWGRICKMQDTKYLEFFLVCLLKKNHHMIWRMRKVLVIT